MAFPNCVAIMIIPFFSWAAKQVERHKIQSWKSCSLDRNFFHLPHRSSLSHPYSAQDWPPNWPFPAGKDAIRRIRKDAIRIPVICSETKISRHIARFIAIWRMGLPRMRCLHALFACMLRLHALFACVVCMLRLHASFLCFVFSVVCMLQLHAFFACIVCMRFFLTFFACLFACLFACFVGMLHSHALFACFVCMLRVYAIFFCVVRMLCLHVLRAQR